MDHATSTALLLATHFATSLFPLTVRLIPVITQIGRLIVRLRKSELTPQACHQFETQLHDQLRELGRLIGEWTFNHIESRDRRDMPSQMCFHRVWYRRRSKTPNRKVATLFGTITLWRYLYSTARRGRVVDFSLGDPLGARSRGSSGVPGGWCCVVRRKLLFSKDLWRKAGHSVYRTQATEIK